MDASDQDEDVLIQRSSASLIADFDRCLGPFLRKQDGQLRSRVRVRDTSRLVEQDLEPFQELPQLLDPYLPKFLPVLAEAFVEHLRLRKRTRPVSAARSQLLEPLSAAICRILYTFCKIRGEKVIVRFLHVETRYLELLLLAIEDAERHASSNNEQSCSSLSWTWHERYVVLLWLSQLFLAPFDLSTISSGDGDDADRPVIPHLQWPSQIPGIALRVIPLGIKYLATPGKERDGAKALLVRVATRKDMQEIGILDALVHWALRTLRPQSDGPMESPYYYIGSLSLLAGVLGASADTSIMDPYLSSIYYGTQAISTSTGDSDVFRIIKDSALARKTMIKVVRSSTTLILRKSRQAVEETDMVESCIGYMLENLADNDTQVRFAASKALSIITFKLDPEMAAQVVEAVLDSLNRNVLVTKSSSSRGNGLPSRDLTAVDPLEWHGLMLTLAHLLYRRSPPADNLADVIHALLMGLTFEKRGPSGSSIGANVRDAACFGIWAVARRYTTAELLRVPMRAVINVDAAAKPSSILQVIAAELVVAGSLDSAGNIRRGSSAALQELVGRHPDTVEEGIALVQVVDYHSVALRSRAIQDVASQATRLSPQYGVALLEGLLGWRGIADTNAAARRVAAISFGILTSEMAPMPSQRALEIFVESIDMLLERIKSLQDRQVEERHGLLLTLAALFDLLPPLFIGHAGTVDLNSVSIAKLVEGFAGILHQCKSATYRKPELIAEAASRLTVSAYPILIAYIMSGSSSRAEVVNFLHSGSEMIAGSKASLMPELLHAVDTEAPDHSSKLKDVLASLDHTVNVWLDRSEMEVTDASAQAALLFLLFCGQAERARVIQSWSDKILTPSSSSRQRHGNGYFHAMARAYQMSPSFPSPFSGLDTSKTLIGRWTADNDVDTRVAILQSLTDRDILRDRVSVFQPIISDGLDDYTTSARGDVGSHVRFEAIKATKTLWQALRNSGNVDDNLIATIPSLFPQILRLAAEKLDRVRAEARSALLVLLTTRHAESLASSTFSSKDHFVALLGLRRLDWVAAPAHQNWDLSEAQCLCSLLAGLATSADTGNEDLVMASRAAVAEFCGESAEHAAQTCLALVHNLKMYQGQDRVVVPTLEMLGFLSHVGVLRQYADLNLRQLCLLTQKACYKSGNVRKIEACIKVYGGVASLAGDVEGSGGAGSLDRKRQEGVAEARRRLGALLVHPWPRVRTLVVDELWDAMSDGDGDGDGDGERRGKLMSVDWGKADKSAIKHLVAELGFD